MTWAEFRIRLHAYKRLEYKQMLNTRELAWTIYIAPHQDPKKIKKSIDAFWPLKKQSKALSEKQIDAIKKAQEQYAKDIKNNSNG